MRLSSILINIFTLNVKLIDTEMDSDLGLFGVVWGSCAWQSKGTRERGNGAYPMFLVFPMFPMFPGDAY